MHHQVIHLDTIIGNGYLIPRIPGDSMEAVLNRFFKAAEEGDELAERALMSCSNMAVDLPVAHRSGAALFFDGTDHLYIKPAHFPPAFNAGQGMKYLESRKHDLAARMQMAYIMRLRMELEELHIY